MRRTLPILLLLFALLLTTGAATGRALSLPSLSGNQEPVVARLYVTGRSHLEAVAPELDIWHVDYLAGYALIAARPARLDWLRALGYRVEVDAALTERMATAALDPQFFYFDDYVANANGRYVVDLLQTINAAYPDLTELIDIGDTWQSGQRPAVHHRDMWIMRVTNGDPALGDIADKPAFFLMATIHAREVATPELALRYLRYLTEGYGGEGGYGTDPDVTWLLDHNVLYLLVMQNPDGHVVNEQNTGANRRKNMDHDDGCTFASSWGVDLNRNHSFYWGGAGTNPCGETYQGPSAASEPEALAFQSFFASVMQDQNGSNDDYTIPPAAPADATGIFITLHSYSDLVLWPWGFTYSDAPNALQLRTIGRKLAYFNGYTPQQSSDLYTTTGTTDDWTYGKFGVASFTYEVGGTPSTACTGFFPLYSCIDGPGPDNKGNLWPENKPSFIYAHKIARTPYLTAFGPDAQGLVAGPPEASPGTPIALTGLVQDHRAWGDTARPIAAAEYFIDTPGADGSGTAMSASDGSWGGMSEAVEAVVDTAGLAAGRHYLLVHGRNTGGDWGPFSAVFMTVTQELAPQVISLAVAPDTVTVGGRATITATLSLADATPVPGRVVAFTADLGIVTPITATSDAAGRAVVTFHAGDAPGTAQVSAQAAGLTAGPTPIHILTRVYLPLALRQ